MLCQAEELRTLALRALLGGGVDPGDAAIVVDALLEAELRGRPTHGFLRLPGIRERFTGRGPTIVTVLGDGGPWLHLDGGDGLGYVAAQRAADEARERAAKHGLALVGVRRTTHAGMLGYYTAQLAGAGLVAMMLADCVAMVAPYGATSAVLGTNPVCVAFPHEPFPVLVDMSTSAATFGDVLVALQQGKLLPEGVAFDASGRPTRDPKGAREGALRTFGGHRGSALALAVQLLTGALVGAEPLPRAGVDYGLWLLAIKPSIFGPKEEFRRGVGAVVQAVMSARPEAGGTEVLVPGERAWRDRDRRLREGLDLPDPLFHHLTRLAADGPEPPG